MHLTNREKEVLAIENITLDIKEGEFLALVGPSGCGKSTFLNIIGGIDKKTSGEINIQEGKTMGYMLQSDCLFSWLTILDNALLGLKIKGMLTKENINYVKELLKTYGLDCFVAKVMLYKEKCGVRVFIQEEVTPENDSYCTCRPSKKSQDLADKWYDEGKFYIEPEWIANCLDKYGKSKVERFLYYCANIDPDILEDVHSGNFGYRSNETPCILDYSNFLD